MVPVRLRFSNSRDYHIFLLCLVAWDLNVLVKNEKGMAYQCNQCVHVRICSRKLGVFWFWIVVWTKEAT